MTGGLEDLDTVEPLAHRAARHNFDRLIMLADGVFAIAVTLSALEIRLEPHDGESWAALRDRLARPLAIYALSFMVASFYWLGHRRTMARIARTDGVFTTLTLVFLACVALIPAATQLLIAGLGAAPVGVYLGLIALLAVVQAVVWTYAAFVAGLVLPEVDLGYRWVHLIASLVTPLLASSLTLLSLARSGTWGWVSMGAVIVLIVWVRRTALPALATRLNRG